MLVPLGGSQQAVRSVGVLDDTTAQQNQAYQPCSVRWDAHLKKTHTRCYCVIISTLVWLIYIPFGIAVQDACARPFADSEVSKKHYFKEPQHARLEGRCLRLSFGSSNIVPSAEVA